MHWSYYSLYHNMNDRDFGNFYHNLTVDRELFYWAYKCRLKLDNTVSWSAWHAFLKVLRVSYSTAHFQNGRGGLQHHMFLKYMANQIMSSTEHWVAVPNFVSKVVKKKLKIPGWKPENIFFNNYTQTALNIYLVYWASLLSCVIICI